MLQSEGDVKVSVEWECKNCNVINESISDPNLILDNDQKVECVCDVCNFESIVYIVGC